MNIGGSFGASGSIASIMRLLKHDAAETVFFGVFEFSSDNQGTTTVLEVEFNNSWGGEEGTLV